MTCPHFISFPHAQQAPPKPSGSSPLSFPPWGRSPQSWSSAGNFGRSPIWPPDETHYRQSKLAEACWNKNHQNILIYHENEWNRFGIFHDQLDCHSWTMMYNDADRLSFGILHVQWCWSVIFELPSLYTVILLDCQLVSLQGWLSQDPASIGYGRHGRPEATIPQLKTPNGQLPATLSCWSCFSTCCWLSQLLYMVVNPHEVRLFLGFNPFTCNTWNHMPIGNLLVNYIYSSSMSQPTHLTAIGVSWGIGIGCGGPRSGSTW